MGNLPYERLKVGRPFLNTEVDFCGPFTIKASTIRNAKLQKAYVAIFICLSKCVHMELVNDLTTQSFLAALKRFFARRGKAKLMMSDNGTNFVGAARELNQSICRARQDPQVANYLASENITWKFIPSQAPEFGGLWEAAVKSFKFHFRRVVGDKIFTYEELMTFLVLIESVLNSRPILALSPSPNDLAPLTPGHFLIGDSLTSIGEEDLQEAKQSTLPRWRRVQQMFQSFWKRWTQEYLSNLQVRTKMLKGNCNLQIGQLVLLKDERTPPLKWPLARICETHPGADDLIRVVTLKSRNGVIKRPINKICPLPSRIGSEESPEEEEEI
ncbi:uncharacterized protein LOC106673339 [Cimex lectularius]|uniref:Integrase catalytic domain-containing protein n=1 Tax=Cimex lectularius TaxID=79782 RepID=A0A8I6SCS1_CIMLE|nr:uncharacterized protein LOC106673339 [Cimex lectularius]